MVAQLAALRRALLSSEGSNPGKGGKENVKWVEVSVGTALSIPTILTNPAGSARSRFILRRRHPSLQSLGLHPLVSPRHRTCRAQVASVTISSAPMARPNRCHHVRFPDWLCVRHQAAPSSEVRKPAGRSYDPRKVRVPTATSTHHAGNDRSGHCMALCPNGWFQCFSEM